MPPLRRAEHGAHEHGDLAAAEFGEQLDGILWRRAPLPGRAQNAVLALEAGIVEPGAAADALDASGTPVSPCIRSAADAVLPMPISPRTSVLPSGGTMRSTTVRP